MTRWMLFVLALAGSALPPAVAAQDEPPRTLESLEEREIEITPSEAEPASPEEMRENYRRLLKLTRDPEERNQILRRLADVELAIASQSANPEPAARRAMNIYQRLSANQSYDEREADLLYRTAHAADLAGDVAAGIVALSRLIRNHPDFALLSEVYFRRAELRFVYNNYRLAEQDYSWIIDQGKQTDFLLQSYYKRGWTRYKLAEYKGALRDELEVLRMLLGPEGIGAGGTLQFDTVSQGNRELAKDALRNMTLDFAALGKAYTPSDFVDAARAEPYEYALVDALVAHYLDQQRYTDASNTALAFAQRNPEHPKAKALEVKAIAALEAGGFDTAALEAKQAYVTRYGLRGESWYGKRPLEVPEVRQRLQDYLDTITSSLHAGAQETDLAVDYNAAAEWYAKYLEIFPDIERAPELAFLRGDALYEAGRYADAATAYERVAYDMPKNDRAAEAAYAAVLARRKAAGETAATDPAVEQATLRFAEQYPDHPEAASALARLAEDRYRADRFGEAARIAEAVIAHRPPATPEQLTNAWRIRAVAAMQAEQYEQAEVALRWLLDHTEGKERVQYQQQLATALYRQGEALVEAGNDAAAADQFLRLREALPAGAAEDIRATALYDAAAASIRADDTDQAITLLERFRSQYPDHKLVPETTRRLAALYLERGDTATAAREFARVRDQARAGAQTRRVAAAEAARLYAESGDTAAAIAAYESYLENFDPGFEAAMEARHQLATLHAERGNAQAADRWRRRLIEADAEAGAARTERSRTLAARAALELAEDQRAEFAAAELRPPLQRTLPEKKTELEQALAAYSRAADYGIAEVTTEATYRTGVLYYDFSQALLDSPRPDDLSGRELAQYEILLEEQAFPFEEEAIGIHEANVDRIAASGIYDEWVRKSLAQLAKLVPARYAKSERLGDGIVRP